MELLILLTTRRGELVTREEIAERLWGKEVFVDIDHGINTAIRKIRRALGDDPDNPRFVETVVGKGYRFATEVSSSNGGLAAETQSALSAVEPLAAAPLETTRRPLGGIRVLLVGAAALALFAAVWLARHQNRALHSDPPPIRSLAVLPLKNLSGDPAQQYFADGMTEELIGALSNIHGLSVISRTSVMNFKDTHMSVPQIAKVLHVDTILEGSVALEGNRVRVNAQLIRGTTDEHIWTEQYDGEYRSILALQEEVARSIADRMKIELTPQQRAVFVARSIDPKAHENYLKGRYYFNQRTEEALNKSVAYFQAAISQDPDDALAYSGLADVYAILGFRGAYSSQDALARAKAAALKAIELNGNLADPHVSLAFIAETHEWDWATAEREYKKALELNDGDARAHHWYAGYLTYVGRFEDGIAEEKRARDLDPLSLPVNNALAGRLLVAGRYDEALDQVKKTLELDSHFAPAHQTLGWAYLNQGQRELAIQEFQEATQLSNDNDMILDLGFAYAVCGKRQAARQILAKLKEGYKRGSVRSGSIGILYGALGDSNEAFTWLNKAYEERDPELTYIKVPGRRFEPLHNDPRLQNLIARMGLPQ